MSPLLLVFSLVAALSLVGALGVVFSRNVVYSALSLLLALLAAAGLFVLLLSPFIALVQVLLYGGAVTILIIFALMLTRARELPVRLDSAQQPVALVVAGAILAALVGALVSTSWPDQTAEPQATSFAGLGQVLFQEWAVPFEIASLVLLVALIGAIVIARTGEAE